MDIMGLGSKDNYAVFTLPMEGEDAFGNATSQIDTTQTVEFWCAVKDQKSNREVDENKRRDTTSYELMADSRDVEALTIDHRGTIDGQGTFVVVDIYEHKFKFQSTIIVKEIT